MTGTLLVGLGGLVGSIARYWLATLLQRAHGSDFPLGTLGVNILGSFVVGLVMAAALERGTLGENGRLLLATGFCGGFTTMSAFSYETLVLVRDGQLGFALGNVAATLGACLLAVWFGQALGRTP